MNLKRIYSCCLPLFFIFWMVGTMIGFSQQKTVSGNVTDENGLPLPGATVIEQGTNNGTTTDFAPFLLKCLTHNRKELIMQHRLGL